MTADPELQALGQLVEAAESPSVEAVVALGVALASNWAGDRRDLRDRPTKLAPTSDRALVQFLDRVRGRLGGPLPTDRGPLAWMSHNHLAAPISGIGSAPAWLKSDALDGGWICTPPRGAIRPDTSMLAADGRLAMTALLVSQCPSGAPLAALTTVCEWFAAIRCAALTDAAVEQCPAMGSTAWAERSWSTTAPNVPINVAVDAVLFGLPCDSEWVVPPPTAAELEELELNERLRAQGEIDDAAWWKSRPRAQVP